MLLANMETQKAIAEKQDERMKGAPLGRMRRVTRQDISLLQSADKTRKYEIEQSEFYIGYKLLWILGLFLQGKKFPSGELDESQFKAHTFNIVDFLTSDQTLPQLLDFDAEAFFQVVLHLFQGKPWSFLVRESGNYLFEFQKGALEQNPFYTTSRN